MRSSDLAHLAGVTVRTLRHYHQLGILTEPERAPNGYREYDVHDLVRLLRIKRLTALGVPLDAVADLLDRSAAEAEPVLDQLDADFAAQIDVLTARRAAIAELRALQLAPEVPPDIARYVPDGFPVPVTPELALFDRELTVLTGHLVGAEVMDEVGRLTSHLLNGESGTMAADLEIRFGELGPESGPAEIERFVDDLVALVTPVLRDLEALGIESTDSADQLFTDYTQGVLNSAQGQAVAAIVARIDALRAQDGPQPPT